MRKLSIAAIVLAIVSGCQSEVRARKPFQPAPDLHVAEREHLDGGFSRDYGFWMRSYSHIWSDAHTHIARGESEGERDERFRSLRNVMYEYNIVNGAVFCWREEDLAFVAGTQRHAPAWGATPNNPDVAKLRKYHEQYGIRGVKLHNTWVMKAESEGQEWEFPLGSGKMVPVSIDYMVSPEWMEFFAVCEELDLPICWHSNNRYGASPYNFGGQNERYFKHLSYDNEYILGHIKTLLTTYPKLKIVLCHAGFMGYRKLDGLFEQYPNLYIDTSAAFVLQDGDYLTRSERDRIRPFFIKWADRILFGTDAGAGADLADGMTEPHQVRRHVYHRVLPHKHFITQLFLPQEALDKITHENFERIFKMERAGVWYW
jgi:predicted TIM-barrel fold metal-dependent hydrolase